MKQTTIDQVDAITEKILAMEPRAQALALSYLDVLLQIQKRQEEQTP